MNSIGAEAAGSRGAFSLDSTTPGALPRGFDAFRRGWQTQIGDGFPLPTFDPDTTGDFRVRSRVVKVRDVAITDLHSVSAIRTAGTPYGYENQVRMYVVRRGSWTLGPHDRSEHTAMAGEFLLRHGRPSHFAALPHTTVKILTMPSAMLTSLFRNRTITGPANSAEMRLLMAHTSMVHETMTDLSPTGVHAAHSTLMELAKAVVIRRFDDVEPLLAPALAQAAKDLATMHLTDPELSPTMLASELNVSIRTLQRAFAATGESMTAYIRRQRLEEARLTLLTAPSGRLSVSALAARWHFADSSHFSRAFKKQYGQTPTEYARSTGPAGNRSASLAPLTGADIVTSGQESQPRLPVR